MANVNIVDIIIRDAELKDIEEINSIYNSSIEDCGFVSNVQRITLDYSNNWFKFIKKNFPILLAEYNHRIIGYTALRPFSDKTACARTAETQTYIRQEYRRQGIGYKLRLEINNIAQTKYKFHTLISKVTSANEISIHLCKKLGFVQVGELKEIGYKNGQYIDYLIFQKIFS